MSQETFEGEDTMERIITLSPPQLQGRERIRRIKEQLPGQVLRERLDLARASHGTLYTLAEICHKVAETLPWRFTHTRGAEIQAIEDYREPIPDEALLKYDDAAKSSLFESFSVVTPIYSHEHQSDPWIVGKVKGGVDRYAVITQWDV